jgi:hypothetical protein
VPQERILEAIKEHVSGLRTWYHWFLSAALFCFLAVFTPKDPMPLFGAEVPRSETGIVLAFCASFFALRAIFTFGRVAALLSMLDDDHADEGLAVIQLQPWTANPFGSLPTRQFGMLDANSGAYCYGAHFGVAVLVIALCFIGSDKWPLQQAALSFAAIGVMNLALVLYSSSVQGKMAKVYLRGSLKSPISIANPWFLLAGLVTPMIVVIARSFAAMYGWI